MKKPAIPKVGVEVTDDELYVSKDGVGAWSLEKYRLVAYYQEIMSVGMLGKWKTAYVELFSGPGRVRLRKNNALIESSPILSLDLVHPFDRYIYCDADARVIDALGKRIKVKRPSANVEIITGDVNASVGAVVNAIPKRHLSLCFLDPYDLGLHFATVKTLARERPPIDFIILLALVMDAKRNLSYYFDPGSSKVELFLGDPDWRAVWIRFVRKSGETENGAFVRFLAEKYVEQMRALGYPGTELTDLAPIKSDERNIPYYYLAYFSADKVGLKFWRQARKYASQEGGLFD